ncbi:uncharacterized protein LOC117785898 [Drosophila innubila]|uniref:uncharacterized protein LOC117785898 n=1 Tax=Drosophila innubila TaxID=198719 RepID=UPI00148D4F4B|nr:uncharacterized protein LOC117785898 [Drosophila innubila]
MDCHHRIEVPLRSGGGKKMKKRRELDALIAHSITKKGSHRTVHSQDKLLSVSTDDPDDYTWMNVEGTTRRGHRKKLFLRKCGPFLFGITTALFVGILYWLYFDLRQQISDYRQKVEDVSAISKIFPDTLQQWHETTSLLIKNQTFVISQLNDLTQNVGVLSGNLSSLQETIKAQRNYGQDEKLVADFGAKLEAVATDIDGIKEHYNRYVELQKSLRMDTEMIKANLSQLAMIKANSSPSNLSNDFNALNQTMQNSWKKLESDLMNVNNTLIQSIKILNGEIVAHKIKLDDLLDRSQSITAHVTTLGNNWQEFQQKIIAVNEQLEKVKGKISMADNKNRLLSNSIDQLMSLYKKPLDTFTTQTNQVDTNNNVTEVNTFSNQGLTTPSNATANLKDNSTR